MNFTVRRYRQQYSANCLEWAQRAVLPARCPHCGTDATDKGHGDAGIALYHAEQVLLVDHTLSADVVAFLRLYSQQPDYVKELLHAYGASVGVGVGVAP